MEETKIGDIVRWAPVEVAYHRLLAGPDLTGDRNCGIVVDKNPIYFFVFWQNGEVLAQKPNTIEVVK